MPPRRAVTKLFLDSNVSEGIITFSPANTSPDFTTWDDNGLYWRTAPSDLLQGEVLGNLIAEDGHKNIGVIYQNDAYGTGLFGVVKEVFEASGGTVVADASYNDGDTSFDAQVATDHGGQPRRDRADHVRPVRDHRAAARERRSVRPRTSTSSTETSSSGAPT